MSANPRRASRRDFMRAGVSGLAGGTIATACGRASSTSLQEPTAGLHSATPADLQGLIGDGRRRRILLRGAVVLNLDSKVGDFHRLDKLTSS